MDRQKDRQIDRYKDRQTDRQTGKQTDRQIDRKDRWMDRWIDGQTDRKKDIQIHEPVNISTEEQIQHPYTIVASISRQFSHMNLNPHPHTTQCIQ